MFENIFDFHVIRADKNIPTNKGEVAAQLTSEGVIKVLLNAMKGSGGGPHTPKPVVKVTSFFFFTERVIYRLGQGRIE